MNLISCFQVTLNLHNTDIPDAITKDETTHRLIDFTSACFADDHLLYVGM